MTAVNAQRATDDLPLARRCASGDAEAIRIVTRANNQRLFRAAWSILKDRSEAEELADVRLGFTPQLLVLAVCFDKERRSALDECNR